MGFNSAFKGLKSTVQVQCFSVKHNYAIIYAYNVAETWTLRAVNQKHLKSFEMWCCRRMEKIGWTDHVKNEKVLLRVKEQRNILHEISKHFA